VPAVPPGNAPGPDKVLGLDKAVHLSSTGDVWLFRGRKMADRAIQVATNSPVNHVGMAVVIDDLPPLMWHAELGRSLPDLWSGGRHRGVQLHNLRDAVLVWANRYGQRAWLRQLDQPVTREMEDALLRTIARLDGTPFPSTTRLASRWLLGRVPPVRYRIGAAGREPGAGLEADGAEPADPEPDGLEPGGLEPAGLEPAGLETAYCAEVLAVTYQAMGLLPGRRRPQWYDAGRFWSGDDLRLSGGFSLGGEIPVSVPATEGPAGRRLASRGAASRGPASRGSGRLRAAALRAVSRRR
jgi:hypothetical protein